MRFNRYVFIVLIVLLACSGSGVAEEEPALRVACGATVEVCQWLENAYSERPNASVKITRASSGDVLNQLNAAPGTQPFDVWWGGTGDTHIQANRLNLLQPYTPRNLDQQLTWSQLFWDLSGQHSVGIYAGTLVLVTNGNALLPDSLVSVSCWSELGKQEYRGQLLIADPAISGTSFTALATVLQVYDQTQAARLISEIRLNALGYSGSGYEAMQRVLAGERAVTVAFAHDVLPIIAGGDDIVARAPCEGTGYEIGAASITRDAQNVERAIEFVEFTLKSGVQNQLVNKHTYQMFSNVATEASRYYNDDRLLNIIQSDFLAFSEPSERQFILDLWHRP